MPLEVAFLTGFNLMARLFGVLSISASFAFLASAYIFEENRWLYVVLGIWTCAMGVAFIFVKPATTRQLDQIKRSMGKDV
jgi:hypothetical protein